MGIYVMVQTLKFHNYVSMKMIVHLHQTNIQCLRGGVILNLYWYLCYTFTRKWSEKINLWSKAIIKLQPFRKSITKINNFLIFGRVKSFVGSTPSFSTSNFLYGASGKGFNFMIASDHKFILRFFWWSDKIKLWLKAIS